MYKEHKIGVVVLAHNEENHIKDTIETLPDFVDKIYVIDGGSTDKTSEIVNTLTDQRIHLIRHEKVESTDVRVSYSFIIYREDIKRTEVNFVIMTKEQG